MFRSSRKFVAVLLAFWFPLFSGNALAVSVAMQSQQGECQTVVVPQGEHQAAATHHAQLANPDLPIPHHQQHNQPDQQDSSCKTCGVCHLACTGYMATAAIKMAADQPSALPFAPALPQFQSFTSAPLDPPPLARV